MNDKTKYEIMRNRELLKGYQASDVGAEKPDQAQGLPAIPSLQKKKGTKTVRLPRDFERLSCGGTIMDLLRERESRRKYGEAPLSLLELSFLLICTQGIRGYAGHKNPVTFRYVPSAGSRHAFEDCGMNKVWCGYYDGNAKSKRVQEKCGFNYQWTTEGVDVPLMGEKRTGHVNLMVKEDWLLMR